LREKATWAPRGEEGKKQVRGTPKGKCLFSKGERGKREGKGISFSSGGKLPRKWSDDRLVSSNFQQGKEESCQLPKDRCSGRAKEPRRGAGSFGKGNDSIWLEGSTRSKTTGRARNKKA